MNEKAEETLENIVDKIIKTKTKNIYITNSACIKLNINDINNCLKQNGVKIRSTKSLFNELNEKGFIITYNSLVNYISRANKDNNINFAPAKNSQKNSQSTESPKENKDIKLASEKPNEEKTPIPQPKKRMTLKEIQEETAREQRENKRPLF